MNLEPILPEIKSDPFEIITRSLAQATEIIAALDKEEAKDLPLEERLDVADAKAQIVRQRKLLLRDWIEQLDQTFPASN